MKIALLIILLTILLYPSGCAVYDHDVKTGDREHKSDTIKDVNPKIKPDRVGNFEKTIQNAAVNNYMHSKFQGDQLGNDKEQATKIMRYAVKASKCKIDNFVGTNLFDSSRKKCFSQEDVALLSARMDFEMLLPKDLLTENPICDELAVVIMQYFYESCHVIQRMTDESVRHMTEKAFYDALGGYLKSYMVPMVQYAFYAGQVSLKTTQSVISLYDQCKRFLNTNGNGWHGPMEQLTNALCKIPIEPLKIECKNGGSALCCTKLNLAGEKGCSGGERGCSAGEGMLVALPKLDAEDEDGFLTNINFPFKCKRIYNLRSEKSSFMIVKFFETVTRCYQYRGMPQNDYNQKFKNWIMEHVQIHLTDEQFYPGFGAVLRVYEHLNRNKKSVKLKNHNNDDDYLNSQDDNDNDYDFTINEDEDYFNEKNAIMMDNMSNSLYNNDEEEANIEFDESAIDDSDESAIDDSGKNNHGNPKIKCTKKPKPKCKPKHPTARARIHCKPQSPKPQPPKPPPHTFKPQTLPKPRPVTDNCYSSYFKWMSDPRFWISCGILIILLLLLIVFILYRRCRKTTFEQSRYQPPDDPTKRSWFKRLCFWKKKNSSPDEEVLIKPDSKSIISGTCGVSKSCRPTSSSSSSLGCKPRIKCMPCLKRKTQYREFKRESTGSYSSTSRDTTPEVKKSKQKVVTINEKKNKTKNDKPTKEKAPKIEKISPPPSKEKEKKKTDKTKKNKSKTKTPESSDAGTDPCTDPCLRELQNAGLFPRDHSKKSNLSHNRSSTSNERSSRSRKCSSWDTMYSN